MCFHMTGYDKAILVVVLVALAIMLLTQCTIKGNTIFVPAQYAGCAGDAVIPPPPHNPRTVESIAKWADSLQTAAEKANLARDDCAKKLKGLNSWIDQHVP